jgi:hypothetical protein
MDRHGALIYARPRDHWREARALEATRRYSMMTRLRMAILAGVFVCAGAEVWAATDEEVFLAVLRKFGVTDDGLTSKKACLCTGGGLDGKAGRLAVFRVADRYSYECRIAFFTPQGAQIGSGSCLALGGSVVVLSK